MMKKFRILSVLLSLIVGLCAFSSLMACSPTGGQEIDVGKTQLYVKNFSGGYGDRWLTELVKRFEEDYAEVSFEDGKKGAQIIIENEKDTLVGPSLITTIAASEFEVFFTEGIFYEEWTDKNLLLDLTDIFDDKLYGEEKTIFDKLTTEQKSYLNYKDKYYGVPHYQSNNGIIYDRDLFDEQHLFFKKDGGWTSADGDLAVGPSGIEGGYDAGLPATYDDFFALCKRMSQKGITPISWCGESIGTYTGYLLYTLQRDYEGADKFVLSYNGGSVVGKNMADIVTGFDAQGNVKTESVAINMDNLSLLMKQPGRYYSLKFFEEIIKNDWYSANSTSTTQQHVMAQADFLYSRFENEPIGMLIDGIWWAEESVDTFTDMEEIYGKEASRDFRNFGYMPVPKVSKERLGKPVIPFDGNKSLCFANGNITDENKIKLVKEFIKYTCTDESLIEFTKITGTSKCMAYDISSINDSLNYFSKSVIAVEKNAEFAYTAYPDLATRVAINDRYANINNMFTKIGNSLYNIPVNTFLYDKYEGQPITARQYFEGLYC